MRQRNPQTQQDVPSLRADGPSQRGKLAHFGGPSQDEQEQESTRFTDASAAVDGSNLSGSQPADGLRTLERATETASRGPVDRRTRTRWTDIGFTAGHSVHRVATALRRRCGGLEGHAHRVARKAERTALPSPLVAGASLKPETASPACRYGARRHRRCFGINRAGTRQHASACCTSRWPMLKDRSDAERQQRTARGRARPTLHLRVERTSKRAERYCPRFSGSLGMQQAARKASELARQNRRSPSDDSAKGAKATFMNSSADHAREGVNGLSRLRPDETPTQQRVRRRNRGRGFTKQTALANGSKEALADHKGLPFGSRPGNQPGYETCQP